MKVLAITVVVLAVLFTVADRVAVHFADQEAARLAKEKYGYGDANDGYLHVSVEGFPFLTQALSRDFDHVSLDAGKFYVDDETNTQGGYLPVDKLHIDLRGVTVTSMTSRSAEANLAEGTLTLSYKELSDSLTRLAHTSDPLQVSQAPGSNGQQANLKVTNGTTLNTTGTLLAQGTELTLTTPGVHAGPAYTWRVELPANTGFTSARSTADGVEIGFVGHLVTLGSRP
ncbi:hypothetical protein AQI88_29090 [Streptomyces cellostaticus]|uniref:DUF2993 domain-containing protein n=1 Tax=Streptomyces cellostaticus TaxID=67285 RepID=A0A101NH74_9ACTN|nr:DUF2993 domain-containing protein [Streptomyces cellostaticus]KUM92927.1 hypothetical protein AQI88_29090 [Streptomyces cellostaticus]GHI04732.1 hypothetical protein Scel_30530 [Streptomyces cellostaticus]